MTEEVGILRVTGKSLSTWTIENFSLLDSAVGRCYTKKFRLEGGPSQIYFSIWPGGETEDSKGYLCFSMGLLNGEINGELRCQVLFRSDGTFSNKIYSFCLRYPITTKKIPKIATRNYMLNNLGNDTLEVILDKAYDWTCFEENDNDIPSLDLTTMSKVANDWRDLWESKEYADCVIAVGGEDIPAHSIVLCVRSKVFAAMFKHETIEKSTHRVEIVDFGKDTVDSMLEFLYSGRVKQMHFDLALDLLRASDKYELSDLKSYCSDFLATHLDNQNICQVLLSADIGNAERLVREAVRYFCENLSELHFEDNRQKFEAKPKLLGDIVMEMHNRAKEKGDK